MDDYKLIKVQYEQLDAIVVGELKDTLEAEIDCQYDQELIHALKKVLKHFMPKVDYDPYIRDLALTELTRINERLGLYDN